MGEDTTRAIGDRVPFTLNSPHIEGYIATLSPDEQEALVVKLARNEARLRLHELAQGVEEAAAIRTQNLSVYAYYDRAYALLLEILASPISIRSTVRLLSRDAQNMVNFLDKVLVDGIVSTLDSWGRIHCVQSEIAMLAEIFPTSFEIKGVTIGILERQETSSQNYTGQYKGQRVRIKEFSMHSTSGTKLFIREISSWSHLLHPNILPFYGVFNSALDDRVVRKLGLVSPWLERNLVEFLATFPDTPRSRLCSDVTAGLEYLHGLNLVHGDLRGANIFVSRAERALIANFELTISTQAELTVPDEPSNSGAIYWMAPELFERGSTGLTLRRRTQPSDIWSLGCVWYEVLTNKTPFYQCTSPAELILTLHRVKSGPVPPLRPADNQGSKDPQILTVDDRTWSTMEKCWERDPLDRPYAKELAQFFAKRPYSGASPFSTQIDGNVAALQDLKKARSNLELRYKHIYQILRQARGQL